MTPIGENMFKACCHQIFVSEGKVVLVTGAARGQGRNHAVRFAQEGADVIAIDVCDSVPTVKYPAATREDLDRTVEAVEALDRRIVASVADIRDLAALTAAVDDGVARGFGVVEVLAARAVQLDGRGVGHVRLAHGQQRLRLAHDARALAKV